MIVWMSLIILLTGVCLVLLNRKFRWSSDMLDIVGAILIILSSFSIGTESIIFTVNHIEAQRTLEKGLETYKALTYKIESDACKDEFGLLSKEVIDEVQQWNTELIYNQNLQRDFWVGILIPNIYDYFETIEYDQYTKGR